MSREERPSGLTGVEKLIGLVLLALGIVAIYYTYMALPELGPVWLIFVALAALLMLVGLALLLARAE